MVTPHSFSTTSEGTFVNIGRTDVTLDEDGGCSSYSPALLTDRSRTSDSGNIPLGGVNVCAHAAELAGISWRPGIGFE